MSKVFDVSLDMSLTMVIRGAKNKTEARAIAARLAEKMADVNSDLSGKDYQERLVTSFSLVELREDITIDEFSE